MNFYSYITLIASAIFMVNGLSIEIGTCDYCSDDFVPIYNGLDIVIGSCNQFQVTTIDTFYDDWQSFAQSCFDFNDQFVSWDGTVTEYDFNALSDGLVAFEESIGDGFEVAYTVDTDYFDDNIVDVWYSLYDSFGRVVEICPTKYQKHISTVAERIKKAIKKYCKKNNCD